MCQQRRRLNIAEAIHNRSKATQNMSSTWKLFEKTEILKEKGLDEDILSMI